MRILILLVASLMAASCVDQDRNSPPDGSNSDQFEIRGVYESSSVDNEDPTVTIRTKMVVLDGEYYVARGAVPAADTSTPSSFLVSELFHGTSSIDGARYVSSNLLYFNPEFQFVGNGRIDSNIDRELGIISGSMNHEISPDQISGFYPVVRGLYTGPPYRLDSISVVRNDLASNPIQISDLAGAYAGTLNSNGSTHSASISLTEAGALVMELGGGCNIEGSVVPTFGVGRIEAASNTACTAFSEIQYAGVVVMFGSTPVALLVDRLGESALVAYFE